MVSSHSPKKGMTFILNKHVKISIYRSYYYLFIRKIFLNTYLSNYLKLLMSNYSYPLFCL